LSNFKIGIDLGTTNSSCCTIENGKFKFLKFKGKDFLKSVLLYRNGKLTIGEKAKKKSVIYPENYISSSKTSMADDGKKWEIENRVFTPTDVATELLREIKSKIESSWKVSNKIEAVITVPAYFTSNQIEETKKAGERAGFIVKQIITEPNSAAMAYGLEDEINQRLLIIDIGGGTFDVSVLDAKENKIFDTKAIDGDKKLGGDNFDEVIFEMFLTNIRKEYGINLKTLDKSGLQSDEYAKVIQKLKIESEEKKIELSKSDVSEVDIPNLFIKDGVAFNFSLKITKEEFEKKSNLLLKKIKKVILRALEDNNIEDNSIDKIVLVGGSSYIPVIQEIIKDIFNKKPYSDKPLDKLVAMGAALIADDESNSITYSDQLARSMGIEVAGEKLEKILEKGMKYPVKETKIFSTFQDYQEEVTINVFEGDDIDNLDNNEFIGGFILNGIQKTRAGIPQIEVSFTYDKNRILKVTAKDLSTGAEKSEVLVTKNKKRVEIAQNSRIVLANKGDSAIIIDDKFIATLLWHDAVDLDLHCFYKLKDGSKGQVFFGAKGNKSSFPWIQLDYDAGVGDVGGNNEENMEFTKLSSIESALIVANIYAKNTNFSRYDGKVILKGNTQEIIVPLTETKTGSWCIVAKIDNTIGTPRLINVNNTQRNEPSCS